MPVFVKSYRRGASIIKAYQRAASEHSKAPYGTKELETARKKMVAAQNKLKTKYLLGLPKHRSFNVGGFLFKTRRRG